MVGQCDKIDLSTVPSVVEDVIRSTKILKIVHDAVSLFSKFAELVPEELYFIDVMAVAYQTADLAGFSALASTPNGVRKTPQGFLEANNTMAPNRNYYVTLNFRDDVIRHMLIESGGTKIQLPQINGTEAHDSLKLNDKDPFVRRVNNYDMRRVKPDLSLGHLAARIFDDPLHNMDPVSLNELERKYVGFDFSSIKSDPKRDSNFLSDITANPQEQQIEYLAKCNLVPFMYLFKLAILFNRTVRTSLTRDPRPNEPSKLGYRAVLIAFYHSQINKILVEIKRDGNKRKRATKSGSEMKKPRLEMPITRQIVQNIQPVPYYAQLYMGIKCPTSPRLDKRTLDRLVMGYQLKISFSDSCGKCGAERHTTEQCSASSVHCFYCDGRSHEIKVCPELHGVCPACNVRGHTDHELFSDGKPTIEILLKRFEDYADAGKYTAWRHNAAMFGFYYFNSPPVHMVTYKHLMQLSPEKAMLLVKKVQTA